MSKRLNLLLACCLPLLASAICLAQSPQFKHSPKAKNLAIEYNAKIKKQAESLKKELDAIQVKFELQENKRRRILLSELKKIKLEETKAGNLDAAVEVEEAIKKIEQPASLPQEDLLGTQVRSQLVGSVWKNAKNATVTFNDNGTVTNSYHKRETLWAVRRDGTLVMMWSDTFSREVDRFRLSKTFREAYWIDQKKPWHYRRVK
ncbi:MAG: hypothetical protein COA78_08340 [Blastopirellula sp.]|nr:MAG: hypothetical protein COA78_08340 [Blastopirellula sp.]